MATIIITLPDDGSDHVLTSDVTARTVHGSVAGGDPYVLVEGGLVQNEPLLPVYDVDVLEDSGPVQDSRHELIGLHERILANPDARAALGSYLDRIEDQLAQDPSLAEDLAGLRASRAEHAAPEAL